jgi:hypothetical protein
LPARGRWRHRGREHSKPLQPLDWRHPTQSASLARELIESSAKRRTPKIKKKSLADRQGSLRNNLASIKTNGAV